MISTPTTQNWGNLQLSREGDLSSTFSSVSQLLGSLLALSPRWEPPVLLPAGQGTGGTELDTTKLSQSKSATGKARGEPSPPLLPRPRQVWLHTSVLRGKGTLSDAREPWPRGTLLKQPAENVETYPMTIRCLQKEQTKKSLYRKFDFFFPPRHEF